VIGEEVMPVILSEAKKPLPVLASTSVDGHFLLQQLHLLPAHAANCVS